MYKLVIFDFDGTLADTKNCVLDAADYSLKQFGIVQDREDLIKFVGPSLFDTYHNIYGFNDEETTKAVEAYRSVFSFDSAALYPGIKELLIKLRQRGVILTVATARMESSLREALDRFEVTGLFSMLNGSNPDGSHSDKAILVKEILEKFDVKPTEAIMIGDTHPDYYGATENEVPFIAALYDSGLERFEVTDKLTNCVYSIEELESELLYQGPVLDLIDGLKLGDVQDIVNDKYSALKPALCLSGGGARGAYEVGAWQALAEMGYEFDAVIGTSVGSINAAMVAQGELELAMKLWAQMDPDMVFVRRKDGSIDLRDVGNLKVTLNTYIDEKKIRESKIRFGLVTYSLTDLKGEVLFVEDIPEGELVDYILASANHPFFNRQKIDGKEYIDGGVYDNLAIRPLYEAGYKNVIAIDIREAIAMTSRNFEEDDINLTVVRSSVNLGNVLNFENKYAAKRMSLGYVDTYKKLGSVKNSRYAIKDDGTERFKIDKKTYQRLSLDPRINLLIKNEKFFSSLVESIDRSFKVTDEVKINSSDFTLYALEILASFLGIDDKRVYTYSEFIEEIKTKLDEAKNVDAPKEFVESLLQLDIAELEKNDIRFLFAYMMTNASDALFFILIQTIPSFALYYIVSVLIG